MRYWYTSRDLSTRFKIKRSFGWDVYFLVALYGCIFVLQGVIATVCSGCSCSPFLRLTTLFTLPLRIYRLANRLYELELFRHSGAGGRDAGFAILFCLYRSNWAGSARLDGESRKKLYKRLAQSSGIEQLLYQCMEQGELAQVTLRSRRIYVGMIHTATLEYEKTANIVLIPMLSGYRDAKTMNFRIENNYSRWYAEHGHHARLRTRSAMSFRKVILLNQIESLSLFDPASASALSLAQRDESSRPKRHPHNSENALL